MTSKHSADDKIELNSIIANKKILELKKRILLAEGQKKAYVEEWEQQEKQNADLIKELKQEIKEHRVKLKHLKNLDCKKPSKEPLEIIRRIPYPPGARTADEAVHICDLQVIDLTKKLDILNDSLVKRQQYFNKLSNCYHQTLINYKNDKSQTQHNNNNNNEMESSSQPQQQQHPPQTFEDDENRKMTCQLENEIHRTNVQWMEAEHVRKKYNSIKATLMGDAERFEKSLMELEKALIDQQTDINRIQEVHREAIQMRDNTKIMLLRQEHAAHTSSKIRERQAIDFRQQVEERRQDLERLERKLFSSGKQLVHQTSIESLTGGGDQQLDKLNEEQQDPEVQRRNATIEMECLFKKLMEITGATSTNEVLDRFAAQKEATTRLNYLRSATENEKKKLEQEREHLLGELELFKFADVKETEVNQEQVEKIKIEILTEEDKQFEWQQSIEHTNGVVNAIRQSLIDLILKLHEIDEMLIVGPGDQQQQPQQQQTTHKDIDFNLNDMLADRISSDLILQILESKLRKGLMASSGQQIFDWNENIDEIWIVFDENVKQINELQIPSEQRQLSRPNSPTPRSESPSQQQQQQQLQHRPASTLTEDRERPQPYPTCYSNLLAGRSTGQTSTTSGGQIIPPVIVATDDEGEVPSRNYLKRQAMLIVDSKSRRKGFRAAAPPPASKRK